MEAGTRADADRELSATDNHEEDTLKPARWTPWPRRGTKAAYLGLFLARSQRWPQRRSSQGVTHVRTAMRENLPQLDGTLTV